MEEAPGYRNRLLLDSHHPYLRWFNKGQDIVRRKMKEIKFIRTSCVPLSLFVIWQFCNLKELNSTFHADFISLRAITLQSILGFITLLAKRQMKGNTKLSLVSIQELKILHMTQFCTLQETTSQNHVLCPF